ALRYNARQGLVIAFTLRLVLTFVLSSEICIFKYFGYILVSNATQLRLQLDVKNVTDEDVYIPNSIFWGVGVGEPRTFYTSIGLEFLKSSV
ncbi:MAG: hypothetical protein COA83_11720, partial [Methylophaga sp.]